MVSYAEARARFALLLREEKLTEEEHTGVVTALDNRWPTYERPAITENLIRLAGDFAQRYEATTRSSWPRRLCPRASSGISGSFPSTPTSTRRLNSSYRPTKPHARPTLDAQERHLPDRTGTQMIRQTAMTGTRAKVITTLYLARGGAPAPGGRSMNR